MDLKQHGRGQWQRQDRPRGIQPNPVRQVRLASENRKNCSGDRCSTGILLRRRGEADTFGQLLAEPPECGLIKSPAGSPVLKGANVNVRPDGIGFPLALCARNVSAYWVLL